MILVVIGFPAAAINVLLLESENAEKHIEEKVVWYDDFIPTVKEYADKYDIEKTIMFGPTSYLQGLAKMIEGIVDNIEIDDDAVEEL